MTSFLTSLPASLHNELQFAFTLVAANDVGPFWFPCMGDSQLVPRPPGHGFQRRILWARGVILMTRLLLSQVLWHWGHGSPFAFCQGRAARTFWQGAWLGIFYGQHLWRWQEAFWIAGSVQGNLTVILLEFLFCVSTPFFNIFFHLHLVHQTFQQGELSSSEFAGQMFGFFLPPDLPQMFEYDPNSFTFEIDPEPSVESRVIQAGIVTQHLEECLS